MSEAKNDAGNNQSPTAIAPPPSTETGNTGPVATLRAEFVTECDLLRANIKYCLCSVQALKTFAVFNTPAPDMDHGEMKANIMLAYRHLEDGRMRLGKAIDAAESGVSIYNKG